MISICEYFKNNKQFLFISFQHDVHQAVMNNMAIALNQINASKYYIISEKCNRIKSK